MFANKSWMTGGVAALLLAGVAAASGPPNGACAGAFEVGVGSISGNSCDAFQDGASCVGVGTNQVLWYSFTAPTAEKYQIDTKGSDFDTVLLVYDACGGTLLACNDDTYGLDSAVVLSLAAGQTVKIAVGGFGSEDCGDFRINVGVGPGDCCYPWDNGGYDGRNAQTSQVGFDRNWETFARVTADDFWLCEDNVYRIRTLRGVIFTDSVVPKAEVVILTDCDGTPGYPVAIADSLAIDPDDFRGSECVTGTIEIRETGGMTADGFRIIEVTATFPKLWLEGGSYWVAFVGYSGTADPEEQFFWGTSGNNVVKGRPGKFYNSDDQTWTDIDLLCCGCTDFNFCLEGEKCKVLLDNGRPNFLFMNGGPGFAGLTGGNAANFLPGGPSLQNGTRTADKSRTADDFVVPPCSNLDLCYIEGYVLTNCDRVRLDIFDGSCHCPAESEPILTLDAQCITEIARFIGPAAGPPPMDGLKLLKAQFFDFKAMPLVAGRNYWISVYALGDNSQNARGYFLWNSKCGTPCQVTFESGCTKGPAYSLSRWQKSQPIHDFAFMVAVSDANERPAAVVPPDPTPCAANFNGVDGVTVQDLFDFLSAWFAGCP